MAFEGLPALFGQGSRQPALPPLPHSETVIISTLALCKMLKHCRLGVPVEVMGLALGTFVDEYTVYVSDVFAMPQVGSSDSVEAVDDVYQTQMLELLRVVGVKENAVGWYHSHPGYHAWLSNVDQATQRMFQQLDRRSIAIVLDPINSINGRIVVESFRLTGEQGALGGVSLGGISGFTPGMLGGVETRVVTADLGFLRHKEPTTVLRGLDKYFYQMPLEFSERGYERVVVKRIGKSLWCEVLDGLGPDLDLGKMKDVLGLAKQTPCWSLCLSEADRLYERCLERDLRLTSASALFSQ